ncbi:MAG TPA: hypothetical protein VMM76_11085 [Pirellulaceae bacterium]|nr:hypothetical protein [Pirellulaceae bacterium]
MSETHRHIPAANIVSSVFLDRRGSDFADGESLLAGIKEQMDQQLLQCFVEQVRNSARPAAPPTPSAQMAPAPSVSAR